MPKTVLVAPLNWGLGHATRCMPIIDELLRQGAQVLLASDGSAYQFLKKEYPHLPIFELPAYNIRYPFANMVLSMALQMPKILRGYWGEHRWLNHFLKSNTVDIIISDNRFGLYHKSAKSIFMTHQVHIQTPFAKIVNALNHYCIKKFDVCWIPDFEDNKRNLSGILSHGHMPSAISFRYIGALSRFVYSDIPKKFVLAAIISGPEPQRTYFEEEIMREFQALKAKYGRKIKPFVIVRGVVETDKSCTDLNDIFIYNYLSSKDLNQIMLESEIIIARSGYSTIMDLTCLQSQAILIPTEGQTEQIYLAAKLRGEGVCYSENQNRLNLESALLRPNIYTGFKNLTDKKRLLPEIISEILKF
jgi:UDP-N-acetylglucosamine transferase subunit ALG13